MSSILSFSQTNSPQSTIDAITVKNKLHSKADTLPALQLQNRPDTLAKPLFNYAVTATSSLEKDGNMNLFKNLTAGMGNASSIEATGSSSVNPYTFGVLFL
ncbi:hypothetical protein [Emticicia sp. 17c]|uniref:hypothetical protein n=1 Tax=Emticicia sp. 17c TaxID=3127704 RepID=UPI00301CF26F